MFEKLRAALNEDAEDPSVIAGVMMLEMASDEPEDELLDSISISSDEEKKIENLIDKIPGEGFGAGDEPVSDKDMADAMKNVKEPTIEDLLSDDDF